MNADIPKQYLKLNNKTIIEHTLDCFLRRKDIKGIAVALARNDRYWPELEIADHEKIITAPGGAERHESVLNALHALSDTADPNDWVLVHDAVRPCLSQTDIDKLVDAVSPHTVGGVLAVPVQDTMKRSNDKDEIIETVDRNRLWHALTPQMFRLQLLSDALSTAAANHTSITDEAMAMELQGHSPLLVEGRANNIKITQSSTLLLAGMYLKSAGGKI